MTPIPLYPLLLDPALKVKVWGGRRLETVLHHALPTADPYGEAWELHDTAVIAAGPLAGQMVRAAIDQWGTALVGAHNDPALGMPLLVKFLDAHEWLSVQVHPDDAQAQAPDGEPRGKAEAWYVLAADPGAKLVIGVTPGTPTETLRAAMQAGTLGQYLEYASVAPGDVLVNLPGGIHALGPGILIYEIQQSSDLTYRMDDWGRVDLDGRPRTLHIEKALAVAKTDALPPLVHTAGDDSPVIALVETPFFVTRLHQLRVGPVDTVIETQGRFQALSCIDGAAVIEVDGAVTPLAVGRTVLIPAGIPAFTLKAAGDSARVLRSCEPG